ncbi:MAG TPA: MATE family efflux transporter [Sphingomonadaceae bacterium]|nr:MATE family efflux transporter [Sphingomonadaceae bacterium]
MRADRPSLLPEARLILKLAWPVMLTSLNWTLMHLIDVAVVGQAGTHELGALAAGRTLTYITIVMGLAALSGILVFTTRADGAGDRRATGDYLRTGLLYGFALSMPCLVILLLWAETLLRAIGVPPEFSGEGAAVVRAMALAYPPQFLQVAASYFLEGVSRPRRVMVVNLTTLPLNALLAWAWVGGHFGLPAMGAVGAVLATAVVSALGAAGMLYAAWSLPDAGARGVRDLGAAAWARAWRAIPAQIRFGTVPAIASGLELAGFSWLIVLSTQLGEVAAAAFQTVFSLHNFAFSMALGYASAAGVRAGNAVGAGQSEQALPRTLVATGLVIVSMGGVGLLFWLGGVHLVAPFSSDPAVVILAAKLLVLLAPFMLFDGIQAVMVYALRSLGEQVWAGINGVIAFFLVTSGLGWYLVRSGEGAEALIHAIIAGMVCAALLQSGRLWLVSARPGADRG